jgi:hypothetical protein
LFINDIVKVLKHSKCLLLADDTKLLKKMSLLKIQETFKSIWIIFIYGAKMSLNIDKCSTISFSLKKKTTLNFNYSINKLCLTNKNTIKDLGVLFDSKLSFNKHVDYIRNKSFMKLGLLKGMCINFHDHSALKTLNFSLVRSQIEYASIIWHTDNIGQNTSLSSVQNNFLRYLSFKCNVDQILHSVYDQIGDFFKIVSLKNRYLT